MFDESRIASFGSRFQQPHPPSGSLASSSTTITASSVACICLVSGCFTASLRSQGGVYF